MGGTGAIARAGPAGVAATTAAVPATGADSNLLSLPAVPGLAVSSLPPQAVKASKASAVHTSRRSEDRTGGARSAIERCIGFHFPPDRI